LRVIKNKEIVEDSWQRLRQEDISDALPEGDIIVPLSFWKEHEELFKGRTGRFGVCINGDDDMQDVVAGLDQFEIIAVDFPQFKDGRSYSNARMLRQHYAYQGEIRAVGDVLRDQLFYMQRCGIDSFQVRSDKDLEDALQGLSDFSVTYQAAADGAQPVYKQR